MQNINHQLVARVSNEVESSEVFRSLEAAWENLVDNASFRSQNRCPEAFAFVSVRDSQEEFVAVEDDGSSHVHVGRLHLGVDFGQEVRFLQSDNRQVLALARQFSEENAELLQALNNMVSSGLQAVMPRNEAANRLSQAVEDARRALAEAEVALESELSA